MNALFDLIPIFLSGELVGAQPDVAALLDTAEGMVPFITPLPIKFSFSLWCFVRTVRCYANIYILLCLVVNLLLHFLSTFSMVVGSLNITIFSCMVSDLSSTWQVSGDQGFKAILESGVFFLLNTFFLCCFIIAVHVLVPRQIHDVQPGHLFSALVSVKFSSLWKQISLQVGQWCLYLSWQEGRVTMFWLLVGVGSLAWDATI